MGYSFSGDTWDALNEALGGLRLERPDADILAALRQAVALIETRPADAGEQGEAPKGLPDGDYVLAEGAAWLDLPLGERTATLRVRRNNGRDARYPSDPGVIVEVYRQGEEDGPAAAALFVAQDDLEPEDDPEAPPPAGDNPSIAREAA